jgi:hypothetical protein
MSRYDKILLGAANYCAYYRHNVHHFARDYLHLELALFQKILLVMMNVSKIIAFIATRGIGKTFLSAVFCVIRCILWPGTKIAVASGTRGQAITVLEKIVNELVPASSELREEIDWKQTKLNNTQGIICFKNSSYIKVVTASDSSRSNRANLLLLDEARMIPKNVIDTILKKFLTQQRMPAYRSLSTKERKAERAKEKNKTLYLTSPYWSDHWLYTKCKDICKFMLDDSNAQFVCGIPYQLPVHEGIINPDAILDEMAESDFNEITFSMEYGALFYGVGNDAFFDFESVSKNRRIKYPMLGDKLAALVGNDPLVRIPPKQRDEIRILSADIALMSSSKHNNDATAIFINQMLPTKSGRYTNNIVFPDAMEGQRTEDQALIIRKLFDEYCCDYLVLDTNGVGLGVYDALAREISDPETGELYPALSCINDKAMADRCASPNAPKVIWSIKASAKFNSDCAVLLREGFRSGRIRLLSTEYDADQLLGELKRYNGLSPAEKMQLKMPYIHTTLLVDELVKLLHEEVGGKVKVFERSGMRKDRYSSLSYNYYVAVQLENEMSKLGNFEAGNSNMFIIRPPSHSAGMVNKKDGRNRNHSSWR